ncbi:MAG: SDR family oxidoreductase [Pseudomonadota bacterium]|nr:SDR family oxidoreductase [Pseudomonadota bacterium]
MRDIILITGGSGGIGAATAFLAARRGYTVCINYLRNRGAAEALVEQIRRDGGDAIAIGADISLEADVQRLFETIDESLDRITALDNNAGILEAQMRVEEMDADRLRRIFATNVIGSFLCARQAVRRMSAKHGGAGGAIVNVSSAASRIGAPGEYVDYAASKGAIDTMTVGLAREVAAEGIRVNAVRPGLIYTDIHASGGEPQRIDRLKDSIPMRRGGWPDEVANAILWLLSDQASYVNGAIVDVTGGR